MELKGDWNVGHEVIRLANTQLQINDGCSKLLLAHKSSVMSPLDVVVLS